MKTIILSVIVLGVILGGIAYSNKVEYTAPEIEVVEVEKEVEVDALEEAIKNAQNAKLSVIEDIAQKAHDEAYNQEMKKVELEVVKAFNAKLGARQIELEKETKTYWRSKSNIVALIKKNFPEEPHTALAIAKCESGLNPDARNPHNKDGSTDGGLWQINSVHDKRLKEMGLDKFDPEDATKFARMLYDERGWKDWVCLRHISMR